MKEIIVYNLINENEKFKKKKKKKKQKEILKNLTQFNKLDVNENLWIWVIIHFWIRNRIFLVPFFVLRFYIQFFSMLVPLYQIYLCIKKLRKIINCLNHIFIEKKGWFSWKEGSFWPNKFCFRYWYKRNYNPWPWQTINLYIWIIII